MEKMHCETPTVRTPRALGAALVLGVWSHYYIKGAYASAQCKETTYADYIFFLRPNH